VRIRRKTLLAAVPLMTGIAMFGSAAAASAASSGNASCNARYVHEDEPPGQYQRDQHKPVFGHEVSAVAHTPAQRCDP
jgi:hypothetical protein